MSDTSATATAHPNIALIKYWGDIDPELHIPANGSISMNLDGLTTRTSVSFDPELLQDQFILNGKPTSAITLARVSTFLNHVRKLSGRNDFARVTSQNNFPIGVGIASSASGFAALCFAATTAAGLNLNEKELSQLARTGSGSACRSVPGGFVEWRAGTNNEDSYAYSIAAPNHWDIVDCIALVSQEEKPVSSIKGHLLAPSSILQPARIVDAPHRLSVCRKAILGRDFDALAEIVEFDSNLMHAVMLTSLPPLLFWQPATVTIMQAVQAWRKKGMPVCYTIDAGPNVHILCPVEQGQEVSELLHLIPGVIQVFVSHPGGPATIDESPSITGKNGIEYS